MLIIYQEYTKVKGLTPILVNCETKLTSLYYAYIATPANAVGMSIISASLPPAQRSYQGSRLLQECPQRATRHRLP